MAENWKQIPKHPNYEVSDLGHVRVSKSGIGFRYRTVVCKIDPTTGDHIIPIHGGNDLYLADVICEVFNGYPRMIDGQQCWMAIQKNGNKADNRAENLHWVDGNVYDDVVKITNLKEPLHDTKKASLWKAQVMVVQRHTGRVYMYPTIKQAASATNMSEAEMLKELSTDALGLVTGKPNEFAVRSVTRRHEAPEKPKVGNEKIRVKDHGDNREIVCHTLEAAFLLTGISKFDIEQRLVDKVLTEVGGYSFKTFKDTRAWPSYSFDQVVKSRMEYMFANIKSRNYPHPA